jgi:hypothetical protein
LVPDSFVPVELAKSWRWLLTSLSCRP